VLVDDVVPALLGVLLLLLPQPQHLLIELLDLVRLLVDVVEKAEVLVLVLDERAHQHLDVLHAGGGLNLVERLLEVLRRG